MPLKDRDARLAWRREYRKQNLEKIREQEKKYRLSNPNKLKETKSEYRKRFKERELMAQEDK